MFITGLGTASPARRYSQKECWDIFQDSELSRQLDARSQAIVRKVLTGNNGIASRHLSLDKLTEAFDLTPDVLHARFRKHAPALVAQAARVALTDAQSSSADIDGIIIST